MRRIPLTRGYTAIIDDVDYDWVSGFEWRTLITENGDVYGVTTLPHKFDGQWPQVLLHRHIMQVYDTDVLVDHRDHDGLNDRRYNLRVATKSQNGANARKRSRASSIFKGVHL